jgi:hypothetical protein
VVALIRRATPEAEEQSENADSAETIQAEDPGD